MTMFMSLCSFQVLTKKIGKGMHEWAAKIDEYARGMIGPPGSTLFEELGLYYIGPVDGNNVADLICVLQEVASLDSMGPVLVHVITKEQQEIKDNQMVAVSNITPESMFLLLRLPPCHSTIFSISLQLEALA